MTFPALRGFKQRFGCSPNAKVAIVIVPHVQDFLLQFDDMRGSRALVDILQELL
jgi:hypothetical protein